MVRREIAPTSQALQVAFSRLFREPMLSESTSFGSRWGIYEMSSSTPQRRECAGAQGTRPLGQLLCRLLRRAGGSLHGRSPYGDGGHHLLEYVGGSGSLCRRCSSDAIFLRLPRR